MKLGNKRASAVVSLEVMFGGAHYPLYQNRHNENGMEPNQATKTWASCRWRTKQYRMQKNNALRNKKSIRSVYNSRLLSYETVVCMHYVLDF
jgi:hypothetical protein